MAEIHPELARVARWLPDVALSDRSVKVLQWLTRRSFAGGVSKNVERRVLSVRAPGGRHAIELFVYRSRAAPQRSGALLWMHGGGYVLGGPGQDAGRCAAWAEELGITVVAVRYRLAPQHPYPAGLEDCYAALQWMHDNADSLGVARDRIAVGGQSAGGGLAAALALLARDRDGAKPVFQLLSYPMLDDRTALRDNIDERSFRLWNQRSNRYAWQAYLGRPPGSDPLEPYAAPGRVRSLEGVAPAWIGVGTEDLFLDEDRAYERRLVECSVSCELFVVEGAYHGFDAVSPNASVSRSYIDSQTRALARALSRAPSRP